MIAKNLRFSEIKKYTRIVLISNVFLSVLKLWAGFSGFSMALIADGMHSLSDCITDIIILISIRTASKPEDDNHHYGHGKAETMAAFIVGIILSAIAFKIGYSSVSRIFDIWKGEIPKIPRFELLFIAFISICIKELLFHMTMKKGRKLSSTVMKANAWHQRSDALSSFAALLGIGGVILLGSRWSFLDPLAAVFSAFMILYAGWATLKSAGGELMEECLNEKTQKEIINIISSVDGIEHPHNMRTRKIGCRISISVHIFVNPLMSVKDSHELTKKAERKIMDVFGPDTFISIHVEPFSEKYPRNF